MQGKIKGLYVNFLRDDLFALNTLCYSKWVPEEHQIKVDIRDTYIKEALCLKSGISFVLYQQREDPFPDWPLCRIDFTWEEFVQVIGT